MLLVSTKNQVLWAKSEGDPPKGTAVALYLRMFIDHYISKIIPETCMAFVWLKKNVMTVHSMPLEGPYKVALIVSNVASSPARRCCVSSVTKDSGCDAHKSMRTVIKRRRDAWGEAGSVVLHCTS